MTDENARLAEMYSGCSVIEARYFWRAAGSVAVGTAAGTKAGRTAEGVRLAMAASVVVLCVLARRVRVETMTMGAKSMVAVGSKWLVFEGM